MASRFGGSLLPVLGMCYPNTLATSTALRVQSIALLVCSTVPVTVLNSSGVLNRADLIRHFSTHRFGK